MSTCQHQNRRRETASNSNASHIYISAKCKEIGLGPVHSRNSFLYCSIKFHALDCSVMSRSLLRVYGTPHYGPTRLSRCSVVWAETYIPWWGVTAAAERRPLRGIEHWIFCNLNWSVVHTHKATA